MAWKLAGSFVVACPCNQVCGCAFDIAPNAPGGVCRGSIVFQVRQGNLDAVNLSGVNFAMQVEGRNKLSEGNWKAGLVIDEAASQEQAQALERIVSGQAGGMFADLKAIFSEFVPTQRGRVSLSDGDRASASLPDGEINFEPFKGSDGKATVVENAMFGFAPRYKIGWGRGRRKVFGTDTEGVYGEAADFEYAS